MRLSSIAVVALALWQLVLVGLDRPELSQVGMCLCATDDQCSEWSTNQKQASVSRCFSSVGQAACIKNANQVATMRLKMLIPCWMTTRQATHAKSCRCIEDPACAAASQGANLWAFVPCPTTSPTALPTVPHNA